MAADTQEEIGGRVRHIEEIVQGLGNQAARVEVKLEQLLARQERMEDHEARISVLESARTGGRESRTFWIAAFSLLAALGMLVVQFIGRLGGK